MASEYDGAASGWARGAALVYAPIAQLLVARAPVSLVGARVLDIGAGTGVSEAPLRAAGTALSIGADLSREMLAWNRDDRPPAVVCDVMRLPFPDAAFDTAVASFVLNHLTDPAGGLTELPRILQPGGTLLATVFANSSHSANRDLVDQVAHLHGWSPPQWYADLKTTAVPLLGSAESIGAAAAAAGLTEIDALEEAVDVDVTEPEALVRYRFGQAQFADWLAALDPQGRAAVRADAVAAIAATMEPYRPSVVFLVARNAR